MGKTPTLFNNTSLNRDGFTLVEVMIALGIASILVLVLASAGTLMNQMQSKSNITFTARQVESNLQTLLSNYNSWANTYKSAANSSLSCIAAGTSGSCANVNPNVPAGQPVIPGPFVDAPSGGANINGFITDIRDNTGAPGTMVYSWNGAPGLPDLSANPNSTLGFTAAGAVCNTYPSSNCPLQFSVYWNAVCTNGASTCANPQVFLNVRVTPPTAAFAAALGSSGQSYNWSNYSVSFYQGVTTNSGGCWTIPGGASPSSMTENCANVLGLGTSSPAYALDLYSNLVGNSTASQLHISADPAPSDDGLYLQAADASEGNISYGAAFSGGSWIAKASNASILNFSNTGDQGFAAVSLYQFSGLTAGSTFTPAAANLGNFQAANFASSSDRRLKEDIGPIEGLDLVLKMEGHRYKWRSTHEPDIGVVAQEMESVLPEAVMTDPKTGYKSVKYQKLVAPLIEATKELYAKTVTLFNKDSEYGKSLSGIQDQLAEQKKQAAAAQSENRELRKRLDELESRLRKLESK